MPRFKNLQNNLLNIFKPPILVFSLHETMKDNVI